MADLAANFTQADLIFISNYVNPQNNTNLSSTIEKTRQRIELFKQNLPLKQIEPTP